MTNYWMHMDPDVFPNPDVFDPTRWICEPAKLKVMYRYFVPFSKGSRACIGREYVLASPHNDCMLAMHLAPAGETDVARSLAYMESYHTIAHLFRPGSPRTSLY